MPIQETREIQVRSLGREEPLEEGMAAHSSILAWRIPWTEEPHARATVRVVAKSQTQLKHLTHACIRCNAVNHSEGEGGQWGHLCVESMYMSPLHTVPDTL